MPLNSRLCKELTKIAKAIGSENIGPERPVFDYLVLPEVNSFHTITLENKGKFRAPLQKENHSAQVSGGGDKTGIERSLHVKLLKLLALHLVYNANQRKYDWDRTQKGSYSNH